MTTVLQNDFDSIPVTSRYTADDAINDGALIRLCEPQEADQVLPIHQISSMDGYLRSYGAILGRKAIHALTPLHVPDRDPLPSFEDYLREPFPAQQHVCAAAVKMMDSRGSGFIVGEMGCIAGESEVYDPVAGLYRRVDQITEPFHVVAYDEANETLAVGTALTPFIKGRKELYKVTLEFGRSFLCTHDHVVLTRSGWKRLDQLVVGRENGDRLRAASSVGGIAAIGWEAIKEIRYERTDIYYDFTVEKFHNYVMAGVVHHNTGKTLIGAVAVDMHARRSRRQGGRGGKYRAIVLCPDHLIGKWCRELQGTIPGAIVTRFGPQGEEQLVGKRSRTGKGEKCLNDESNTRRSLRDVLALLSKGSVGAKPGIRGKRWKKPDGPEWYVLGRNQAKWLSDWIGLADEQKGFANVGGRLGGRSSASLRRKSLCSKTIVVDHEPVKDEYGRQLYDANYKPVTKPVLGQVYCCPRCGAVVRNQKGVPVGRKDLTSGRASRRSSAGPSTSRPSPAPTSPTCPAARSSLRPRTSSLTSRSSPRSTTLGGSGSCWSAVSRCFTTRRGPTAGHLLVSFRKS